MITKLDRYDEYFEETLELLREQLTTDTHMSRWYRFDEEEDTVEIEAKRHHLYTDTGSPVDSFVKVRIFLQRGGGSTRTLVFFRIQDWPSCCALMLMSGLNVASTVPDDVVKSLRGGLVEAFGGDGYVITRIMFAYSEEEYEVQDLWASLIGFEDEIEPFVSVKTYNMIHMPTLVIASKDNIELAETRREERELGIEHDDDDEYF